MSRDAPPVSAVPGISVTDVRRGLDELRKQHLEGRLVLTAPFMFGMCADEFVTKLCLGQNAKRRVKRRRIRSERS